jgi:hypothetical protein
MRISCIEYVREPEFDKFVSGVRGGRSHCGECRDKDLVEDARLGRAFDVKVAPAIKVVLRDVQQPVLNYFVMDRLDGSALDDSTKVFTRSS